MTRPDLTISRRAAWRRAWTGARVAFKDRLRLPPKLTLSQWADAYRVISPPAAEAGPWKTDRVPFMREIMDTISGREYQDITVVKPSQSAATEACINNPIGYYVDQEPSSILVIQPNVKPMAEGFSKTRLAPMLRDSPRLRGKVRDARSRDSGNTVLQKSFPGGELVIVGANSPAGLASWPIRVVLADELDRWPASAGTEGDPLALAEARQITYRHRKKRVKVSSPGNEGESRIEKEWALSDQRHYYVPCPHCEAYQPLEWRDSGGKPDIRPGKGDYRLVWEKTGDGDDVVHKPETAVYVCRACGAAIEETHKPAMLVKGRWVKHNPTSKRAGFFISGLLSVWVRWREIAEKWLAVAKDPEQRKTFFNTLLGLLYVHDGEVPDADKLSGRRESWGAEVPMAVGVLTMCIDVNGDWLEVEVRGWASKEESYLIRLERLYGDVTDGEVWARAQTILDRPWTHESGATMRIRSCMVDSGHETDTVYTWVRPRQGRRVYAAKGVDGLKAPISKASRANKEGVKVFSYNPTALKDVLFRRLKRAKPGPGYLHFGTEAATGADEQYFHQFGAEKRVVEWPKNIPVVKYLRLAHRRNEAIDLYVLNLVALRSLGRTVVEGLGKTAEKLASRGQPDATPSESPVSAPEPPADDEAPVSSTKSNPWQRRKPGGGFMDWRRR